MNKPLSNSLVQFTAGAPAKYDMQTFERNVSDRGGSDPETPRGVQYAKFNGTTGAFTYGRANAPVPPGQQFIVPLHSMRHGWIHWEANRPEKDTEVHVSAFAQFPQKPDNRPLQGTMPRPHDRDGWSETVSLHLVGYGGKLDGFILSLSHSSEAIKRFWGDIGMAAVKRDAAGEKAFLHPVIEVIEGSYEHKDYNREIYTLTPKFVGWSDGNTVQDIAAGEIADQSGADEDDDVLG